MRQPLREGLVLDAEDGNLRVLCSRCGHVVRQGDQDWARGARERRLPVKAMGPLYAEDMATELMDGLVVRQLSCPACGLLFETALVEATPG